MKLILVFQGVLGEYHNELHEFIDNFHKVLMTLGLFLELVVYIEF